MKTIRFWHYAVIIASTVAVWAFFQFGYEYSFFYKEQNQLFVLSPDYVSTYLSPWLAHVSFLPSAGWLAQLLGDFLTSLYYYEYAGAAIFSLFVMTGGLGMLSLSTRFIRCFVKSGSRTVAIVPMVVSLAVMSLLAAQNFSFEHPLSQTVAISMSICLIAMLLSRHVHRYFRPVGILLVLWLFMPRGFTSPRMPDMKTERYLAIDNLYYFGRYDEVVNTVAAMSDPSPLEAFYYYLVEARRGELPYIINKVKPVNLGTLYKIGPQSTPQEIKAVAELYFALGDWTLAERQAMLSCVFSPANRSSRMIRRLAEVNIAAGDRPAAMKYLRILSHTIPHRRWAESRMALLNSRSTAVQGEKALPTAADALRTSADGRSTLTRLLDDNPRNRLALDLLLCTDYLAGARELFVGDIDKYYIPIYGLPTEPMYRDLYKNK